jgi:hypothetical protein
MFTLLLLIFTFSQGEIKLFHKKEESGQRTLYTPLPPVPWKDTKMSNVLPPDFDTPMEMINSSFHQVESFVAQNGNDRVHLQDFVVFCHIIESDQESEPKVSNISYELMVC